MKKWEDQNFLNIWRMVQHYFITQTALFQDGVSLKKEVDCDCYGGIQITNKILNSPNLISFDEDQETYDEDGGIYFGHGWMALPLIGGDYREEIEPASSDIGKLSWTIFYELCSIQWTYLGLCTRVLV